MSIPTSLNLLRVIASKQEIVEKRVEKLQRRETKALEASSSTESSESTDEA